MAKSSGNQQEKALVVLRENLKALKGKTGYKKIATDSGRPESLGRTINFFVTGDNVPQVDTLIDFAVNVLQVDPWLLFIDGVSSLTDEELEQLRVLVAAFVKGGKGMRQALDGTHRGITQAVSALTESAPANQVRNR